MQNQSASLSALKQAALASSLRTCRLFAGLAPADLEQITAITTVKSVEKDDYLFREGTPAHGFYIVQKGAINVHRVNAAGKEQVLHVFRTGESFAEATLAMDTGYPSNARALEPSQVLLVRKDGFLGVLKRHPELALRMIASMSLHLRTMVSQIEDLTLKDVETRLANWLVKRCPDRTAQKSFTINLPMTKRVLASELGTVSETFSRTLAKFRELGLISVKGKSITVLSPVRLTELLRQNLGE